ncbi:MAG: hypothetical protein ACREOO_18235, partial [bacterium]
MNGLLGRFSIRWQHKFFEFFLTFVAVWLRAYPETSFCHAEGILVDSAPRPEIGTVPESTK